MIAHFYDMFAVRKFVPTIPFLRPVLVALLSMTITINNSSYKLTKKKGLSNTTVTESHCKRITEMNVHKN